MRSTECHSSSLLLCLVFVVASQHYYTVPSLAVQCIVLGPVCGCVCVWVCYHDNSKLCATIFTELGL